MRRNVIFGFLGTQLDGGITDKRWERWRPTVGLMAPGNPPVARLELFMCKASDQELAERIRADIAEIAPQTEVALHNLNVNDPWNFPAVYAALHEFAQGYAFDDATDYFIHLSTGTHVAQICLFLLTEARYFPGKLLGTRKASGDVHWHGTGEVIDLDLSTYDQLASRFRREQTESQSLLKGGIVTRNERFNALISRIETVSLRSTAPMLLSGPTGAGKSQLASRIYALRSRKHLAKGRFVEVNCATLRGDNAMSALFGHKKGAFTGAVSDRPGLLMAADKGILFLDEIGELGLDEQAMLLRALEDKRFLPMGSDKEVASDFQLLAGTNKDLSDEVAKGRFRSDLLARLNVWTFQLPGLAERREDIEPNLDYELECASGELGFKVSMNTEARQAFLKYALVATWPGNFRHFRASVLRMATLADGGRIRIDDVRFELEVLGQLQGRTAPPTVGAVGHAQAVLGGRYAEFDLMDLAQLDVALKAVAECKSLAEAGRMLYAVSRKNKSSANDTDRVKKLLARFGLEFWDVKQQLAKVAA